MSCKALLFLELYSRHLENVSVESLSLLLGLTSIKKDMTDISHGYEDLGLLLKDKIAELNTKLTKLQKAQEESSAMMQWLQKMNKTATKWHQAPTPTDTEAVKTQVEQNKVYSVGIFTEDMEEN